MNHDASVGQDTTGSDLSSRVRKRMVQVIGQFVFLAASMFISAGRFDWLWAWAYIVAGIVLMVVNTLLMPRELIALRGEVREGAKPWDRKITALSLLPTTAIPIISGLDERFGWSPEMGVAVNLAGLALMFLGQGLFTWAMVSNPFFSTMVRIQTDRGQTVATGGPYRWVRHPGYVGYTLSAVSTALLLGSLWALVPAFLTGVLLVVRTALEDRTLLEELPGYEEYARQVRYRLVPGVW